MGNNLAKFGWFLWVKQNAHNFPHCMKKKNLSLLSTFSQLQRKWFIWSLVLEIALFLAFLQKWILILFILISINELREESIVPNSAFQQSFKFIDRF